MKFQVSGLSSQIPTGRCKLDPVRVFYRGSLYSFPSTIASWKGNTLTSIQSGGVLGYTLGMVSDNGRLYPGGYSFSRNWATRGEYLIKDGYVHLRSPVTKRLKGKALILGVASHFGHFHVDLLDRIADRSLDEYDWIVIDEPHRDFSEWLFFYGLSIPKKKLLSPAKNQIFWFDLLDCFTGRSIKPYWSPETLKRLGSRSIHDLTVKPRSLLFITRQSASSRRILNHKHLQSQLSEFNFMDMAVPGIHGQVLAFSRSNVVVGPIGSDLFNLIHCRPGTLVICVADVRYLSALGDNAVMIQSLAESLGLVLTFLAVDGVGENPYTSNYTVEYKEVKEILERLYASPTN